MNLHLEAWSPWSWSKIYSIKKTSKLMSTPNSGVDITKWTSLIPDLGRCCSCWSPSFRVSPRRGQKGHRLGSRFASKQGWHVTRFQKMTDSLSVVKIWEDLGRSGKIWEAELKKLSEKIQVSDYHGKSNVSLARSLGKGGSTSSYDTVSWHASWYVLQAYAVNL